MSTLKDKIILMTGAFGGMGALMAQKMAEAGARISWLKTRNCRYG